MANDATISLNELSPFVHLCGDFTMRPGFRRRPWFLPEHHMIHVQEGSFVYTVGPKTHRLTAGDLLLIPAGVWSQSRNPSPASARYHSVHFDFTYRGNYETLPVAFHTRTPENAARVRKAPQTDPPLRLPRKINVSGHTQVQILFERIIREVAEKRSGYELATKACVLELLVLLHRGPDQDQDINGPAVNAIQAATQFLDANYARPLALADIAEAVHLSPVYFGRIFKKATGLTPMAYLTQMRIDQSKRLLFEGKLSVAQVAMEVGFSDPYYFSRVFRKLEGMAPTLYRELALKRENVDVSSHARWRDAYDAFAGASFFSVPPVQKQQN